MVKNTTGGNKHKRSKNSNFKSKRVIVYPDNKETLFAYITRTLGDCRFEVLCSDSEVRNATVRGALYKNTFINAGDLVLIGLRTFETTKYGEKEKCDIIMKYQPDEMDEMKENRLLKYKNSDKLFLLTSSTSGSNTTNNEGEDNDYFSSSASAPPSSSISKVKTIDLEDKKEEDSDVSDFDFETI